MPNSVLLNRMSRRLRRPLAGGTGRAIQAVFLAQTQRVFDSQGASIKAPWEPLSPVYANRKRGPQILIETGRLIGSVTNKKHPEAVYEESRRNLIIGTSVPYAFYVNQRRQFFSVFPRPMTEAFVEALFSRRGR